MKDDASFELRRCLRSAWWKRACVVQGRSPMDSLYSPYDAVPVDTAGRQAWRCHEERSRPLGFANITAHLWPQLIHGGRVLIATLHEANVPRDKWTHAGGWVEIMDVDG